MARQSGYIVNGLDEIWRRVARSESLFMRRGSTATHHAPNFRTVAASEASEIIEDSGDQLYDKLFNSLFVKEMDDKRYSDIIRIAHIVTFEHSQVNGSLPPVLFDPVLEATEEDFPDKLQRQMYRMLLIIKQLLVYFCEYDTITRDRIVEFTFEFFNQYVAGEIETRHFNLGSLFKQLHDKFTNRDELFCLIKVKKVLKFLHISVVISAIEELRSKLKLGLEHLTKDIHSKQGWRIVIKLNDRFVEVRHVRRESVLKQQGEANYWEIEYNVTASFDNAMKTFSAVRLALTDLQFSPDIDITLKEELQKKFFNGRFIVC